MAQLRIENRAISAKVTTKLRRDYLDYSAMHEQIAEVDAVCRGIETIAGGVDEKTDTMIHNELMMRPAA